MGSSIGENEYPLPNEELSSFYKDSTVLITGATGFLGKVIIYKLLSCTDVKAIYILLRPKKNLSIEERHKEFLKNLIFDQIKNKDEKILEKIKPVKGDIGEPYLGLDDRDQDLLIENVNIVIHSAATVRFTEPLNKALKINAFSIQQLIELSCKFKKLKSLVHVSTAYSNPEKQYVKEIVYPSNYDLDVLLSKSNSENYVDEMDPILQKIYPNTYTLTKNIAENIIMKNQHNIPICIIRPSIVTAAYKEPYPGWIDNYAGPTGLMEGIYRGLIRTFIANNNLITDIVPVDLVANACITAAWHHISIRKDNVIVYNCTSGNVQNITWRKLLETFLNNVRIYPTKYMTFSPRCYFTINEYLYDIWGFLTLYLPSFLYDIILRLQGKKPIMMKFHRLIKMTAKSLKYFTTREWKFEVNNYNNMLKAIEISGDNVNFPCDMNSFIWDNYIKTYTLGIRKYLMKDSVDSLESARRKLERFNFIQKIVDIASGYFIMSQIINE